MEIKKGDGDGDRRKERTAVLEEMDDAGPLLGLREERGEEGDGEVVPEGGGESRVFKNTQPTASRESHSCDGLRMRWRRS